MPRTLQQALGSGGKIAGDKHEQPERQPSKSNDKGAPAFPNTGPMDGSTLAASAPDADVALSAARRLSPADEEVVSNNVSAAMCGARDGGPAAGGGTSAMDSIRQREQPQVSIDRLDPIATRSHGWAGVLTGSLFSYMAASSVRVPAALHSCLAMLQAEAKKYGIA